MPLEITSPSGQVFSVRLRWVMLLCVGLVFLHTWTVESYLDRISKITFTSHVAPSEEEGLRDISLGVAADGQTWIRVTEERIARGDWRFHQTQTDNAPKGRAVYWSAAWSTWLELGGRVRASFTGESLDVALAKASRWSNFPLFLGALVCGGLWVARRWGNVPAIVLLISMVGSRGFYAALYPAYPDHHGAAVVLTLGLVFGVLAMEWSGNACPKNRGRKAVWLSALCGGAGLSISASTLILPIALAGLGGVVAAVVSRRSRTVAEARVVASRWVLWGQVGAGCALAFYFLEHAPADFAWRLEVNHPAYALAWWGGAQVVGWCIRKLANDEFSKVENVSATVGVLAAVSPLLILGVFGASAFTPIDSFLSVVHNHINEVKPMWTESGRLWVLFTLPLVLPLLFLPWAKRGLSSREQGTLAVVVVLVLGLSALALFQQRWWSSAAAAQIALAVMVTAGLTRDEASRRERVVWVLALVVMLVPGPWLLARERVLVAKRDDVQTAEAMQLLYRDVAATLRLAAGDRKIVLLAAPNASVAIGYYGGIKTVGAMYWENIDGLRATAEILTSGDDMAAERIIRERGITHVVMVSPGDFTAEYADALRLPAGKVSESFGRRALDGRRTPTWLRAIPYRVPPQFARLQARVSIYAVDWEIGRADSCWALGMARLIAGDERGGRAALRNSAEAGRWQAALILSWRMATAVDDQWRDGAGAMELALSAIAKLPEAAAHRRVLAAAYAAAGRWSEAQATALFAIDQAHEAGDARLVSEIEAEFGLYQERRALRN